MCFGNSESFRKCFGYSKPTSGKRRTKETSRKRNSFEVECSFEVPSDDSCFDDATQTIDPRSKLMGAYILSTTGASMYSKFWRTFGAIDKVNVRLLHRNDPELHRHRYDEHRLHVSTPKWERHRMPKEARYTSAVSILSKYLKDRLQHQRKHFKIPYSFALNGKGR